MNTVTSEVKTTEKKSVFDDFTRKYALSKTLRFELKPVGKTLENMKKRAYTDRDGKVRNDFDEGMATFLRDQEIEDAYQALKPVLDRIHEEFIMASLESEDARQFGFKSYLELYRRRSDLKEKEFEAEEKKLRKEFSKWFGSAADDFKESAGNNEKGEPIFKKSDFKILTEAGVMKYIEKNAEHFPDILPAEKIREHLKTFEGLFTYFSGFSQNRENYYATDGKKATAIATRVVHENLPTFCDNALLFENKKVEYEKIYDSLASLGKSLEMKDVETGETKSCVPIVSGIFDISRFNRCLSQKGIEAYNAALANANFLINLHNQQQSDAKNRLKIFKTLYKQIGCGKRTSFIREVACERESEKKKEADLSLEALLRQVADAGKEYFSKRNNDGAVRSIADLARHLRERESFEGVYWSKVAFNTISSRYLANWHELQGWLVDKKVFKKSDKGSDERAKIHEVTELAKFFEVLDANVPEEWKKEGVIFRAGIIEETEGENKDRNKRYQDILAGAASPSRALLGMILSDMEAVAESFVCDADSVIGIEKYSDESGREKVKEWLDSMLTTVRIAQYFNVRADKVAKAKGEPMDGTFAEGLKTILRSDDADWFQFYDLTRNFLTKKPQDDAKKNKLKLNFENSTLAGGWDVNKEPDNFCILLRGEEGSLFLVILAKENKNLFEKKIISKDKGKKLICKNPVFLVSEKDGFLQKMEYDFWADASKMIPKCSTQLKAVKKHFTKNNSVDDDFIFPSGYRVASGEMFLSECRISKEIFELNNRLYDKNDISTNFLKTGDDDNGSTKYIKKFQKSYAEKDVEGYKDALCKWIGFCKDFLSKYPKSTLFSYNFRNSKDYRSVDEFYSDVDRGSYRLIFSEKVNRSLIDSWVDEGKLYLFEIRNQDSNENKKERHRDNLHTMYWRALFEDIENRPKLNGEAEIFYRRALPAEKLEKMEDKNRKLIIKHLRFSKEKFVFHVPITLNFCRKDFAINREFSERMKSGENFCFLGIDRGEKHLAYYSLVDADGKLLEQRTLNIPFLDKDGNPRTIRVVGADGKERECRDYNELLEARTGDRDFARKNWKTIGTIKELKDGYISQVVRKIVDIAVSHGAFIVLENLNIGFKRGRQKIEKSVYQKLELALAKKLNFLVDKSAKPGEIGSVTRALQLTPLVNTFGDIKPNQFGIMLYVRANYTSQTDPRTGWRKTVYLKHGSEENIRKEILGVFSDIRFDGKDYAFTYTEKLGKEQKPGRTWILYSGKDGKSLDRFRGKAGANRGEWNIERYDIVKMLDSLFANFDNGQSFKKQLEDGVSLRKIEDDDRISKYSAFEQFRFAIDIIQQIRNTGVKGNERDADFLQSPVRDGNGEYYDSRVFADEEKRGGEVALPTSGDANGAYNIARKGIIASEHIRRGYKPYISDEEWSIWLEDKEKWRAWMQKNEKDLKWEKKEEK